MIEDDAYRRSTQYRLWSFTTSQLSEQRRKTNHLAAEKVRAQFRRSRLLSHQNTPTSGEGQGQPTASSSSPVDGSSSGGGGGVSVDLSEIEQAILTPEDEVRLVDWGVRKVQDIAEIIGQARDREGRVGRYRIRSNVVTTACQLLRRFYLTTSPMTYHPRPLLSTFLLLAAKAEHFYLPVPVITSSLRAELDPSITDESIKAPEFLILQALRFTLDVRHAHRGLPGIVGDMKRLVKERKIALGGGGSSSSSSSNEARVSEVAGRVKQLLAKDVQGTDAYFLYTPSQICLAVWKIADAELLDAYLHAKLAELSTTSTSTTGSGSLPEGFAEQLRSTVDDCARLITTTYHDPDDKASRKVLNRISKKLMVCADPDKIDIVAVMRAKKAEKRDGGGGGGSESGKEEKRKKRRLEAERDGDVFGGKLKDVV